MARCLAKTCGGLASERTERDGAAARFEDVADCLDSDEAIAAYLEAAADEGDPDFFITALGDVARAKGINQMAKEMNVGRESLYKSFSKNKNPHFKTVCKAIKALGFKLSVVPA